MTDVDEALKGFAAHSGALAGDQDLRDVMMRAEGSRRARGTRVLTAVGVAAAFAAIASVVFVLSKHDPVSYSSPQPGQSLSGSSASVSCSPLDEGGPPMAGFAASSVSDHCVVRVVALEGLGTISPPTASAPGGSLEKAEALLETAVFYPYVPGSQGVPSGRVWEVLAGYGAVNTDPRVGAVRYESVDSWVLAWRIEGAVFHCPLSTRPPNYRSAPTEEWHFLVVPSNGQPPAILNAVAERCGELQPASADAVFRHMRPTVDSSGNYVSYECPPSIVGDTGTGSSSGGNPVDTVNIVVGVPEGATSCTPVTTHLQGFVAGKTVVVGPPGEIRGWPAGVPRP